MAAAAGGRVACESGPLPLSRPEPSPPFSLTNLGAMIGCPLTITSGDWRSGCARQTGFAAAARRWARVAAGTATNPEQLLLLLLHLPLRRQGCMVATAEAIAA